MSVSYDDVTYDEQDHLNYGVQILKGKSGKKVPGADFNSTMPVTAFNALPRAVEQLFEPGLQKTDGGRNDVKAGRYVSIAFGLVLLVYLFAFGKAVAGPAAGCWAMFLGAIDPNLLAHSRLVTTDLYGTLGFIAALYHLYRWLVCKERNQFYFFCIAIAIAQVCKVNNMLLYPVCFIAMLFYRPAYFSWRRFAWQAFVFLVVHYLVINTAFLFYQTGLALKYYEFRSTFFQTLQQSWFSSFPLPLPKSFVDTFDLVQYERETFAGTASNYLLGELRYKAGFWWYYVICFMVKTPLITQLLLVVSLILAWRQNASRKPLLVFFFIPLVLLLFFVSSSAVQGGYRYLLPLLSLSFVVAGAVIAKYADGRIKKSMLILGAILMIPALIAFPNYIAYTSEWLWPKRHAYRYVSDSNLNWGQRQYRIKEILRQHPDYIFEPGAKTTGMIVVDINNLTGIFDAEKFRWLREHYDPVAVIEGCYLLYDIKELR